MTTYEKQTWVHIAIINLIAIAFALLALALAGCGGPTLAPPADGRVWRFGAPCLIDRPQDCGASPLVCADILTERGISLCAMECSETERCPAGSECQTVLGLCFKLCLDDGDCAPSAVCNKAGRCVPDCRVEPQMCAAGRCGKDGRCSP